MKDGKFDLAIDVLTKACGVHLERIPEIGSHIFSPQISRVLDRRLPTELSAEFRQGITAYDAEDYREAARCFKAVCEHSQQLHAHINLAASYLHLNDRRAANYVTRRATRLQRRTGWPWQLAYNHALSISPNDRLSAVNMLERRAGRQFRVLALAAALCYSGPQKEVLRDKLLSNLEQLRHSAVQPSNELRLALAAAMLAADPKARASAVRLLTEVVHRSEDYDLLPPTDVNTMGLVRRAYKHLSEATTSENAVHYLNRIVEAQQAIRARPTQSPVDTSVGVEFAARQCLIIEHRKQQCLTDAIFELARCEDLIRAYADRISLGFIVSDWSELARLAYEFNLLYSSTRYLDFALAIDPTNTDVLALKARVEATVILDEPMLLDKSVSRLVAALESVDDPIEALTAISNVIDTLELVRSRAPYTYKTLRDLVASVSANGSDLESDDRADQLVALARAELPANAVISIETVTAWISRNFFKDQRDPFDIDVLDEKLWPRSYESEACCVLAITQSLNETAQLLVVDGSTGKTIWSGPVEPKTVKYVRWVVEREDGFVAGEHTDIQLIVESRDAKIGRTPVELTATVAELPPLWPAYPTGALNPDDLPGHELYGRSGLIGRIVQSLRSNRAQETYLVEGIRQMGKTSLLKFIKQNVPSSILPVYINLEVTQSSAYRNIWECIAEHILRESSLGEQFATILMSKEPVQHNDLVQLAQQVCEAQRKSYILLLLDELHVLLRDVDRARGILADLRTDLNETSNRISVVLADRYTLAESEQQVPSEYWLQLTPVELGPLDFESMKAAIETPCQGTDVRFLPDAIRRIFHWTGGYPFHVQRLVQSVISENLRGPWLIIVGEDIDAACPKLIEQDRLFQEGLCRKDRIDLDLQRAISAILEWQDMGALLPTLLTEPEWQQSLKMREPRVEDLLAGIGDTEQLIRRLVAVGVLRQSGSATHFFSPLLDQWLKRMRSTGRSLVNGQTQGDWGLSPREEVAKLSGEAWARLDAGLLRGTQARRLVSPLRLKVTSPDSWNALARVVDSRDTFLLFLQAGFDALVDGREERRSILQFPWLALAFHRLRLVRNIFFHGSVIPSNAAVQAWDQVYLRSLGRCRNGGDPTSPDEWRAIQLYLLRTFHIGYRNAISIVESGARLSEST